MREKTSLENITDNMFELSLLQTKLKLFLKGYDDISDKEKYVLLGDFLSIFCSVCDDLNYAIKDSAKF